MTAYFILSISGVRLSFIFQDLIHPYTNPYAISKMIIPLTAPWAWNYFFKLGNQFLTIALSLEPFIHWLTSQSQLDKLIKIYSKFRPINHTCVEENQFEETTLKIAKQNGFFNVRVMVYDELSAINEDNISKIYPKFKKVVSSEISKIKPSFNLFNYLRNHLTPSVWANKLQAGDFIVVSSSFFLNSWHFNEQELEAVIWHELGHVNNYDNLKIAITDSLYWINMTLASRLLSPPNLIIALIIHLICNRISRQIEYGADLYAHTMTDHLPAAFLKIKEADEKSIRLTDAPNVNWLNAFKNYCHSWSHTHPSFEDRIELNALYKSALKN